MREMIEREIHTCQVVDCTHKAVRTHPFLADVKVCGTCYVEAVGGAVTVETVIHIDPSMELLS
jgi:hypothetical protein